MQYENYRQKILKIADVLGFILRNITKIAVALIVVLLTVSALVLAKGSVGATECKKSFEYGDEIVCKANAFLSKVSFEYCEEGSGEWSESVPVLLGKYSVRAVAKTSFGGFRYGEEAYFEIVPREIEVTVAGDSTVYGETPRLSADLASGDTIECESFIFEDVLAEETFVTAEASAIRLRNSRGEDISYAYIVKTPKKRVKISQRPLTVTVSDISREYNGMTLAYDGYELSGGSLKEGDSLIATFDVSITNVGSVINYPTLKIVTENGEDATHKYDITENIGKLTVEKRTLIITTPNLDLIYDDEWHSAPDYLLSSETAPIEGHTLTAFGITKVRDAGVYENSISFAVLNALGEEVSENYAFLVDEGTITIGKRAATVKTGSSSWYYDGKAHEYNYTDSEGLLEGHGVNGVFSRITDAGTAENRINNVYIYNDDYSSVTKNYDITYVYGTLSVLKRPITIVTGSAGRVYDGKELSCTEYEITSNMKLADYQILNVYKSTGITDVGRVSNEFERVVVYFGDENVTANYDITYEHGTLEIFAREITLKPKDTKKVYDGKPLYGGDPEETEDSLNSLADGHRVDAEVNGSRTEIGMSPSSLSDIKIVSSGVDVTKNYLINTKEGKITVTVVPPKDPLQAAIKTAEDEKVDFTSVSHSSENIQNALIGRVTATRSGLMYLRITSYGDYTKTGWDTGIEYGSALPDGYSYNYLTSFAMKNLYSGIDFAEIESLTYFLPYYIGFDGDYEIPMSDVAYSGDMTRYSFSYYSDQYEGRLLAYGGDIGEYSEYEKQYRSFVYDTYLALDDETREYMNAIIAENGFDSSDIYAVADYIKNSAKYNLDYDNTLNYESNIAIAFLEEYKEGVCMHYATAATLLYRALGIPARYVHGFVVDTVADTEVEIRLPGHAWVEVYIDGIGWVKVEVTGDGFIQGTGEQKKRIEVIPSYQFKKYDGEVFVAENRIDMSSGLRDLIDDGFTYSVRLAGSRLEVGRSAVTVESFILYDKDGNDVTDEYDIVKNVGIIEVFPRYQRFIAISLNQLQKYYDGTPLSFDKDDYYVSGIDMGASVEHELNIQMTDAGVLTLSELNANRDKYVTFTATDHGEDVTDKYVVIFVGGISGKTYIPLEISPRSVEITSATDSKLYDGTPLENKSVSISKGSLADGDVLAATVTGTVTEVGECYNTVSTLIIYNKDGEDVTDNYIITVRAGMLTVVDPEE